MCGITGFWGTAPTEGGADIGVRMAETLRHRGPDDGGIWTDGDVVLAHRRLAIIDTSQAGHQPMLSADGRFVLAYNGETYNHLELRAALGEVPWKGHSDTETILATIRAWGIEATLKRLVGMFALAIWDRERRQLTLARDRVGEKPLYYGIHRGVFLFGSELKALAVHPAWVGEMDKDALTLYMRYGYVPQPLSIWKGIRKLLPGTSVTISANALSTQPPEPVAYWRASDVLANAPRSSEDEIAVADELERLLRQSIAGQMLADVPLGAFLSGGVDSSVVVALMQAQSTRPVRTFTIGFADDDFDEAVHAKAVASHLGTDHTELYVSPADALAVIPRLAEMYDEPFADSSQIPTHLVAALARREVTVCLSGDGGDELFGGYNRYFWGRSIWRGIGPLPQIGRRVAARMITALSPATWDTLGHGLPGRLRQASFGDRLHKLAGVVDAVDSEDLYRRLISLQRKPYEVVVGGSEPKIWADGEAAAFALQRPASDFTERMMFQDLVGYMTDDILTKVDRATMSVSLESRVPLLDHRLIEFAASLPLQMKIRNGQGKWLLRQVLYRYVPKDLIERPKQGFGVPLAGWLRGPLRDWAESLLNESRLSREGLLCPEPIRAHWEDHLSGRRNMQHWLWNVLMFQSWRERWVGR